MAQARAGTAAAKLDEAVQAAFEQGRAAGVEAAQAEIDAAYERGRTDAQAENTALAPADAPAESYEQGWKAGYEQAQKDARPPLTLFEEGKQLVERVWRDTPPGSIERMLVELAEQRGERFVASDLRLLVGIAVKYQAVKQARNLPDRPVERQGDTEYVRSA